jgi:hypothetical protein
MEAYGSIIVYYFFVVPLSQWRSIVDNHTLPSCQISRSDSVAYPGPGSEFFPSRILPAYPGSRVKKIPDPGSGSALRNLSVFNPKNCFQALGNKIRDIHPRSGSRIRILGFYPSRIPDKIFFPDSLSVIHSDIYFLRISLHSSVYILNFPDLRFPLIFLETKFKNHLPTFCNDGSEIINPRCL